MPPQYQIPSEQNSVQTPPPPPPPPQYSVNTESPRRKPWKIIFLIIIILVAGGVAAASYFGYITIPFLSKAPYNEDRFLSDVTEGLAKIDSASYEVELRAYTKAKDADATVLPGDYGNEFSQIPMSFDVSLKAHGATVKVGDDVDGLFGFSGDASFGDFSASAAAEGRKVGKNLYGLITKMPFFFSAEDIKGKWIKITPEDAELYNLDINIEELLAQAKDDDGRKKIVEEVKLFLKTADESKAITLKGSPVSERLNSIVVYRYDLEFDRKNIIAFYKNYVSEYNKKHDADKQIRFDQTFVDELNNPEAIEMFDYIKNNMTMSVWATNNGIPVQFRVSFRIVPATRQGGASEKQMNFDFTLALNDVNKSVKIEAPSETISLEEAEMLITGKSKDEILFERQNDSVSKIQSYLRNYKYTNDNKYPASLDALDIGKVLVDAYTRQPFNYVSDGSTYSISYTVKLPEYQEGMALSEYISYQYLKSKPGASLLMLDGSNTADEKSISKEALAVSKIDTDGDGVSDSLENFVGTNKNKKDTDGDGVSDYNEIMNSRYKSISPSLPMF